MSFIGGVIYHYKEPKKLTKKYRDAAAKKRANYNTSRVGESNNYCEDTIVLEIFRI